MGRAWGCLWRSLGALEEHGGAWGLDLPVSHDVERPLEASAGVWEALGRILGGVWEALGRVWEVLGGMFYMSGTPWEASGAGLGGGLGGGWELLGGV